MFSCIYSLDGNTETQIEVKCQKKITPRYNNLKSYKNYDIDDFINLVSSPKSSKNSSQKIIIWKETYSLVKRNFPKKTNKYILW